MDITPQIAKALGFPAPAYMVVERERRWLCHEVPRDRVVRTEAITDRYITGSRLRLREARPIEGGPVKCRLSRKADVDLYTRLVTSIYLPEEEFALLATSLGGPALRKLRHRVGSPLGVLLSVDEFQGELAGLIMVEADFSSADALEAFPMPDFAFLEVTADRRFGGDYLVRNGLPKDIPP
jgi:CYTH domain-containing protein